MGRDCLCMFDYAIFYAWMLNVNNVDCFMKLTKYSWSFKCWILNRIPNRIWFRRILYNSDTEIEYSVELFVCWNEKVNQSKQDLMELLNFLLLSRIRRRKITLVNLYPRKRNLAYIHHLKNVIQSDLFNTKINLIQALILKKFINGILFKKKMKIHTYIWTERSVKIPKKHPYWFSFGCKITSGTNPYWLKAFDNG